MVVILGDAMNRSQKKASPKVCCLCGQPITKRKGDAPESLSMDHVPSKQFYPPSMLEKKHFNLWTVPTHKKCNNDYQHDEDYFYVFLYPLVAKGNPMMADVLMADIKWQSKSNPQKKALIRQLLATCKTTTKSGIILPAPVVQYHADEIRLQRIAIKIVQGLFFREYKHYLPRQNVLDLRRCETPEDPPEIYKMSWAISNSKSVTNDIFSFRHASLDGRCYFTLVFWEAFMIGAVIQHLPETKDIDDLGQGYRPLVQAK
jgi:hypothetical protein